MRWLAVGALGFELGFGAFGVCEGLGCGELGLPACGEGVAFAGAAAGVAAGHGDLLVRVGLGGGDLRGGVAAELLELGGRRLGGREVGPAARRHLDDLPEADSTAAFWDSGEGRLMASGIFRIEPRRELAGLSDTQIGQASTQRTG